MTEALLDRILEAGLDHRTPTYQALGYCFTVRCDDPVLVTYLRTLFEPFESEVDPATAYTFGSIEDGDGPIYLLYADKKLLDTHRRADRVLSSLFWHVNRQVVAASQDRLLVHASAVAVGQDALVFPAPMESGKTTLAAGLVRAGLGYLTDETVAIDLATGLIDPFPRALSVDRGSWEVLAEIRPTVPSGAERYVGKQWQVPPSSIRPDAIAGPARPRLVITPQYRRGGPTELTRLGRADAVRVLAEQSFNFHALGSVALRSLAALVRGADCYRLSIADLEQACRLVMDVLGDVRAGTQSMVGVVERGANP